MGRKYPGKGGICRRVERWVLASLVLFVLEWTKERGICEVWGWIVGVDGCAPL